MAVGTGLTLGLGWDRCEDPPFDLDLAVLCLNPEGQLPRGCADAPWDHATAGGGDPRLWFGAGPGSATGTQWLLASGRSDSKPRDPTLLPAGSNFRGKTALMAARLERQDQGWILETTIEAQARDQLQTLIQPFL